MKKKTKTKTEKY